MKTTDIRLTLKIAGLLLLAGTLAAQAQNTYIKQASATAINAAGSWSAGGPPGTGDIGEWNSVATSVGDTIASVGGAYSMGEIQLANNVAGAVSLTDTTTGDILTLDGATSTGVGIDMSVANQNLTLGVPLTIGANQTWKIASGRNVTQSGPNGIAFGTSVLTIVGPGTFFASERNNPTTASSSSAGAGIVLSNAVMSCTIQTSGTAGAYINFLGANTALIMSGNSTYTAGEVASSGNHHQAFTGLTLNPGTSILNNTTRTSSSGNSTAFTTVTRNGGSMADIAAASFSGGNTFGSSCNGYGLPGTNVLGWATLGANDWALPRGTNFGSVDWVTNATSYSADVFTTATNDVTVTGNDSPATFTINSLRFNILAADTLTLSGLNTITTGGILVGSTTGVTNTTITGGSLTSGNVNADSTSDLIVINNTASSGNLNIYSTIVNNGATAVGLTAGYTSGTAPTGFISLSAANTFSGATTITKGTLMLSNSLALQNSILSYNLAGTINFGSLTAATLAGINGSVSLTLPSNFALTLGNNNASSTYSGAFSGTGAALTKTGSGTLTLNGNNLNTGNTTVSGGTLALGPSGTFGGAASLASSATLDVSAAGNYSLGKAVSGTGTINGNVIVASGGQLSPTGSTGTLTLNNNLTLNGGTVAVSVNAATPANGIVNIGATGSGNLTNISGTIQLTITGGTLANGTYKIIGVPNGLIIGSGSLLSVSGFAQTGQQAALVANTHELDLVVSTYISQNLIWKGDGSANLWNVNSALNWNDTGPTVANPSVFKNGDSATLDDSSANPTVNLSGTLSPASVTVNGSANNYILTSTGKISGSTALTNNNTLTLTVLTTNDYTGGTTINAGTVQVGNGTTAGGEIGTGPVKDNAALVFDLPAGSQTVGAVGGSGTLTTTGTGTIVLNGADTLGGATTVTTGTIKQGTANVLPNGAGVGDTTVNGTLDMGGQSGTVNGLFGTTTGIINNSGAPAVTLTVEGSSSVNPSMYGGLIENTGGALAVNFNGIYGNELQLSTNNTYTGGTTVTAGTLQLGDTNAIAGGSLNVVSGATLDLNAFSPTIDYVTGAGTIDDVSAGGNSALTLGNSGGSGTFSGIIQNSSGTVDLVKNGGGTETLTGNSTFSGYVTVNGGTLALATGGNLDGSSLDVGTAVGSGTFLLSGGTITSGGGLTIGGDSGSPSAGTVTINSGSASFTTTTIGGNVNGGVITINGGNVSLGSITDHRDASAGAGVATLNSGLVINGGTVTANSIIVSSGNSGGDMTMTSGSLNISGVFEVGTGSTTARGGFLTFSGGLLNSGGNSLLLNDSAADQGTAFFSGGTNILGGITMNLAGNTGGSSTFTMTNTAVVYLGSGGLVESAGVATATINLTGGILGSDAAWSSSVPLTLAGTRFQTADVNGNPNNITLTGALGGATNLVVTGSGTLTLTAPNFYTGGTVVNGSVLNINGYYALGGANYGGLVLTNSSTLQYAAAFSGNGSGDVSVANNGLTLATGTETIDVNGNNVTYGNAIGNGGSGSLTLLSTVPGGVLNLQGVNTYTGNTTIGGGTLNVNGSIGSTTVTVGNGGLGGLGGIGTVSGHVEIQGGGFLAPGTNGVGTLTLGNLTLDSGSTNDFGFSSATNSLAVVTTSGGFVINDGSDNAVFSLYAAGGSSPWTTAGTYNLIQYTGTAPTLDSTWTTTSATNPHIGNPQLNRLYAFGVSGGYLTLTITLNASTVAGVWTNNADGNWTVGTDWSSNPKVPHAAGDTATLGNSTAFRTVTLNANESVGALTFNNANSFNIASGGDTLTLDGTGVGADVYVLGGTANSIQTSVALNDNAAVSVSGGDSLAVSGVIANSPSVTKTLAVSGSGTLALSGNNSYGPAASSGFGTTVSGPTVKVGNNNALAAGDVSIAGNSTLQSGAAGISIPNNVDVASGVTVTVNNNGNNFTLGGSISDSGGLTEVGTGTLVLNGNNTYSGNTTVNAGVLSISQAVNVQSTPTINLNGGDLLGTGSFSEGPNIGIGPVSGTVPGTGLIDAASGQQFTVSGAISSAGNTGTNNLVINSGPGNNGMVILNGINLFKGTTVISNGVLDDAGSMALQNSTLNYNNQGGSLIIDAGVGAITLGGLTGSQSLALTNANVTGATVSVGNNNLNTTYSGDLYDAALGGALTKVGTGIFTLTGTNYYNGATTINGGVLELTNNGVLDGGAANIASAGGCELLIDGGSLTATNASDVGSGSTGLHVTAGSANFPAGITANHNTTAPSPIQITGGTVTAASLTLGRTGLSDTTQPTAGSTTDGLYISNGVVNITGSLNMGASSGAQSSVNTRVDAGSLTVGGVLYIGLNNGGRWSVVDVDGGSLTVTDAVTGISVGNALAGDAELLVRAGTVSAGIISLGYGAVADTVVLNQTGGSLYVGSGGIVQPSPAATASITLGGGLLGASTNWINTNAVQLTGSEIIQAGDAFGNAQAISLAGPISGSGPLISSGKGTNTVSVVNTYTSATIVSNGTFALIPSGSIATSSQVAIGAGATFDMSALGGYTFSTAQTLAGISTNGAGHIAAGGNTVTLNSGSPVLLQALGSPGGSVGKISVAGNLTFNANTITISATGSPIGVGTYRLLDCTGTLTGAANSTPVFTGAGSTGGAASITTTAGTAGHVDLTVLKATPVLQTLPTASNITNGNTLSLSILSGGAVTNLSGTNVAGTFAFTSPSTMPPVGTANQSVTFTPTDTADYNSITMNVSVTVVSSVLIPTNKPAITGFSLMNTNVVLNATNGQTGGTYYLLTTTNLVSPISQWTPAATNVVTASGGSGAFIFTGTNVVKPGAAQQYYILSSTNN